MAKTLKQERLRWVMPIVNKEAKLMEVMKVFPYGKRYYQYTAIDCASRWRYIEIYDEQSNYCTVEFLKQLQRRFPFPIRAIKTDNHPTFTNRSVGYPKSADPGDPRLHPLDLYCASQGITHYLIDKGKPAQNGTIEHSHRSDQETFYNQASFTNSQDLCYKIMDYGV